MEIFDDNKYVMLLTSVRSYYQQTHRVYHNWNHIIDGVKIAKSIPSDEFKWNRAQQLAWLFHDIVYNIGSDDNEKQSVALMYRVLKTLQYRYRLYYELDEDAATAETIIRNTQFHIPSTALCKAVLDIDMYCFSSSDLLHKANANIKDEYCLDSMAPRYEFLRSLVGKQLYHTDYGKKRLQPRAEQNIADILKDRI